MSVGKVRKILHLVPDAIFINYEDEVVDWLDARPQPSQAELDIVTDAEVLESELDKEAVNQIETKKFNRFLFEIHFNQENRVRVLEGKIAITKQQYKDALIALYKAL